MPQIRIYDSQANPGTVQGSRRATAADAGGQSAAGLNAVGGALGSVQKAIDDKRERDAVYWAENTLAKARGEWSQRMVAAQQNAPPGAPEFTQQFLDSFDEYKQSLAQAAPTEKSRRALQTDLENLRAIFAQKAVVFEAAQGAQHRATLAGQTLDDNLNSVRADPTLLGDALAQNKRMIDGLQIPADMKTDMHTRSLQDTSLAAIDGQLDAADTVEAAQAIADDLRKSGRWKESLSTQGYARALARADTKVNQLKAQERKAVVDGLADAIPEMEAGIRTDQAAHWEAQVEAVIDDPKERRDYVKRIRRAAEIGDNSNFVRGASPDEILARRAQLEAQRQTPGDYRLDAHALENFDAAVNLRNRALEDDAATYVIQQSDDVQRAWAAMAQEPTPENRQQYVMTQAAEQARLKGSDEDIDLLPKQYLHSIGARLRQVENSAEGAKNAYNALVSEADAWGNHWPMVYRQLAREKILSGHQLIAARMSRVDQRMGAENLLTAAAISKDLDKQFDDKAVLTDLKLSVHENLADLQGTLAYQAGGPEWYARFQDSTNTLARYYMTQGATAADAAARAASEIVNNDYSFHGTFRVPTRVSEPEAVAAGAEYLQAQLDSMGYDIVPPPSLAGMDPELVKPIVMDRLRSEGVWVTNANETGLVLVNPMDNAPVMVQEGGKIKTLEVTWDRLREAERERFAREQRDAIPGP